jgi:hypothetical protein
MMMLLLLVLKMARKVALTLRQEVDKKLEPRAWKQLQQLLLLMVMLERAQVQLRLN